MGCQESLKYIKRMELAKKASSNFVSLYNDANDYYLPNLTPNNDQRTITAGVELDSKIYDTTPVDAFNKLVGKIQSSLTPPFEQWTSLKAGNNFTKEEQDQIAEPLQQATNAMFDYIWASNFDMSINEAYQDLVYGTGALFIREGTSSNPLVFESVPPQNYYPEEDVNGVINTVFRDIKGIRHDQMKRLWSDITITKEMQERISENESCKFDFIEGTIFEPEIMKDGEEVSKWIYVVIEKETSAIVVKKEVESSPWIVFRWRKRSGEVFGRGSAIDALPSVKTLNGMAKFELKHAAWTIAPPFFAHSDGVFNPNTVDIQPGMTIPISVTSANNLPVQQMVMTGNLQFAQLTTNDMRQQINDLFFTQPLGEINAPAKTATEISIRQKQFAEETGPTFGRLEKELLRRIIDRIVYILVKKDLLPLREIFGIKGSKLEVNGKQINLQYQSPLSIMQRRSKVESFQELVGILQQTIGPQMSLLGINVEELPSWLAKNLGVDLTLVKSKDQVKKIQEEVQKLAEQQQDVSGMQPAPTEAAAQAQNNAI